MIPEEILPTGVIQIILTNSNQIPISERLIFNTNLEEKINARFKTDKLTYNKREEVKATLEITDRNNNPLKANFSISVIDNNGTQYDASTNILSTLLLTSDLKGYIEDPAYYFMNENENIKEQLDLVMLTHGWTRYDVNTVFQERDVKTVEDFEVSQKITGTLKGGLLNKPKANEPVSLLVTEYGFFDRMSTDNTGKFQFDNFEFPDGTEYLIQGKEGLEISLDEEVFPAVTENIIQEKEDNSVMFENDQRQDLGKYVLEDNNRIINLKPIVVTANKPEKKDCYHPLTSRFTKKIGSEEIERLHATDLYRLLESSLPTVNLIVSNPGKDTLIPLEASNRDKNPLILVDNVEIRPEDLIGFPATIVESIEYLNSNRNESSIFGLRAYYGVILITTKQGGNVSPNNNYPNMKVITSLGYQIKKEFYSPVYTAKEQIIDSVPDFRTTIYWNPNVSTQENGKADFNFYTSDNSENYSVIIEGITNEGKIVYSINLLK